LFSYLHAAKTGSESYSTNGLKSRRVEVIGKRKESSYQPSTFYRSVLFVDLRQPEGSEAGRVWKSLAQPECQGLMWANCKKMDSQKLCEWGLSGLLTLMQW